MKMKLKVNDILAKTAGKMERLSFNIKRNSPQLLVAGSILTGAAAIVTACIATRKIDDVLEEHSNSMEKLERAELNEDEHKNIKAKIYVRTGLKMAALYAPTAALAVTSGASMLWAFKITETRYNSLSAAFMATDQAFKQYRGRVIDQLGEEVDHQLRFGKPVEQIEESKSESNEPTTDKPIVYSNAITADPYIRIFDETNPMFEQNGDYNLNRLIQVQSVVNNSLRNRGFVMLWEVLQKLGYPVTPESLTLGWVLDRSKFKYTGDNDDIALDYIGDALIDFGIYDKANSLFINGEIPECRLLFNVHGNVYDLMRRPSRR